MDLRRTCYLLLVMYAAASVADGVSTYLLITLEAAYEVNPLIVWAAGVFGGYAAALHVIKTISIALLWTLIKISKTSRELVTLCLILCAVNYIYWIVLAVQHLRIWANFFVG